MTRPDPTAETAHDRRFMQLALRLAGRALGTTAPNPAVGAVIVDAAGDRVLGRGWTGEGGRPHAETEAIAQATALFGAAANEGATAYVSLEPCCHTGKTAPCTQALIAAGIARVVVACEDPDPRVNGAGLAALRDAGIAVTVGVERAAAERLNEGFFRRVVDTRPLVTLKVATSLDGRIATHGRHSQWITGAPARRRAHLMRAEHDAIMVGAETAILDNPRLTCRLPGLEGRSPKRVVVDTRARLPLTSELVIGAAQTPTYLVVSDEVDRSRRHAFSDAGVHLIEADLDAEHRVDIADALRRLADVGVTRLLVEGGATLAAALIAADLVDRLAWFRAAMLIGGDGLAAVDALGIETVDAAPRWRLHDAARYGDDILETYGRLA